MSPRCELRCLKNQPRSKFTLWYQVAMWITTYSFRIFQLWGYQQALKLWLLVMAVMQVLNNMPQKALECTSEHWKFSGGGGGGHAPRPSYSVAGLHPPSAQVIAKLWLHHSAMQLQKRDRSTPLAIILALKKFHTCDSITLWSHVF